MVTASISTPDADEPRHIVLGERLKSALRKEIFDLATKRDIAFPQKKNVESRLRPSATFWERTAMHDNLQSRSPILIALIAAALSGAIVGMVCGAIGAVLAMITWGGN